MVWAVIAGLVVLFLAAKFGAEYLATEGGKIPRIRPFTVQFADRWLAPGVADGKVSNPTAARAALVRVLEKELAPELVQQTVNVPRSQRAADLRRRSAEQENLIQDAIARGDERALEEHRMLKSFFSARATALDV